MPAWAAHYRLQDRATVIVRTYAAHSQVPGDTPELRSALMQVVRGQGLEDQVGEAISRSSRRSRGSGSPAATS